MKKLLVAFVVVFAGGHLFAQETGTANKAPEVKVPDTKPADVKPGDVKPGEMKPAEAKNGNTTAGNPEVICKNGNKYKGYEAVIKITPQNDSKTLLATVVKQTLQNKNLDVMPKVKPIIAPLEVTRTQSGVQRDYKGNGFHLHIPLESFVRTKTHTGTLVMLEGKDTKIDFSCTDQN